MTDKSTTLDSTTQVGIISQLSANSQNNRLSLVETHVSQWEQNQGREGKVLLYYYCFSCYERRIFAHPYNQNSHVHTIRL